MTTHDPNPGACPIVGITGVAPIRPVSVRRWPDGWVVLDHGGLQRRVVLTPFGQALLPRPVLGCCCFSFAVGAAEVLAARYRGDDLPGWFERPGATHPPMRAGATCPEAGP